MTAATDGISLITLAVYLGPALLALSGVPGLVLPKKKELGQKLAMILVICGSIAGLGGAAGVISGGRPASFFLETGLPFGPLEIGIDPLSALFQLPIYLVTLCCTVYATGYWPARNNPATIRRLTFFFGTLTASIAFLVMARNGVLFLIAWEIMALSNFFVLTTEDNKKEVRDAGILYLITTHIGTLALFATFSLLNGEISSFQFPVTGALNAAAPFATAVFVTALAGFGMKAGFMPLHVWLPSAHANAPSHVSAVMSGVVIKMGIYGLIRTVSFFSHIPLWWGATILVIGIVSGVAGVLFAIGQHDLKRLLAYHSIENIGIIAMGIGVALIGRSVGNPLLTLLGITGALLHVLNHATFKALLFLCAGSVIHATGTREIDLMGGLGRRLPFTSAFFLTGAIAICGLPPLNGFVSELLIYLGLFNGIKDLNGMPLPFLALAAPALALIGGLAIACFVKVFGVAFLGFPRSPEAEQGHEAGREMLAPMALLALICAGVGVFPATVAAPLQAAAFSWAPELSTSGRTLAASAPFTWVSLGAIALLAIIGLVTILYRKRLDSLPAGESVTWDCGYLRPSPRMQYSASSFAEMLVTFFGGVLRPHSDRPQLTGILPEPSRFASHVPETALELVYLPALQEANSRMGIVRKLQHGQLHLYILYTFITLIILLVWSY